LNRRIEILALQSVVFFLVAAAFSTVYITQPVLPVLAMEFRADPLLVSLTVSSVVLGIAISIVPIGALADRMPVRPILLVGGSMVAICGLIAASSDGLWLLIAARFVQGLFVPTLTTCLIVYLARSLPAERLNVVMGSYVSATVAGGLGGRMLSGWVHAPEHWRQAFVTASALVAIATLLAVRRLHESSSTVSPVKGSPDVWTLARRPDLLQLYLVAFASFFVFSSIFNFLPFYLASPPLLLPIQYITALYLAYVIGIIVGPVAGSLSDRIGNGLTMVCGAILLTFALLLSLQARVTSIGTALALVCAGYFAIHASAVAALNSRLSGGRGRANALYVLFYYAGGFCGITLSGYAYARGGWPALVAVCALALLVPITCGLLEQNRSEA